MATGATVLKHIQEDTQATGRDVVKSRTIDDDVAVGTFKNGRQATLGLTTGRIVKVAGNGSDESFAFFVNRNRNHIF